MTGTPHLFAEYMPEPEHRSPAPPGDLVLRAARAEDAPALARIAWERNGGLLPDHEAEFARALSAPPPAPDDLRVVALLGNEVAGYGRASRFAPAADAPPGAAPAGWYLFGVTVAPRFRRRGIARALTRARLDHIARHADRAYYFASALNRASIELHCEFGFVELTREFRFPGVSFTGGTGILFVAPPAGWSKP